MPQVSVVIPLYNAQPYLADLKQVWEQTYTDFELVLVDDCSSDNTWEQLQRFKAAYPERAIVLARNERNLGPGGSRNHGLQLCTGQYVIFIDGDDQYEPEFLEHMVTKLEQSGADLVCCGAKMHEVNETITDLFSPLVVSQVAQFNASGGGSRADFFTLKTLLFHPSLYPVPWNKMVRRDFLLEHNLEFPDFRLGEDKCWGMQLVLKARKIDLVNEALYHHITRSTSLSVAPNESALRDLFAMFNFEFNLLKQTEVGAQLYDTWYLSFWDAIFSFIDRRKLAPEWQRKVIKLCLDFCEEHQLDYSLEHLSWVGRWAWYRLLPKSSAWAQKRALLKEQYRLARFLRRFNQLLTN